MSYGMIQELFVVRSYENAIPWECPTSPKNMHSVNITFCFLCQRLDCHYRIITPASSIHQSLQVGSTLLHLKAFLNSAELSIVP